MSKKVLVIGSGGREDAMLWKLAQPMNIELFAAPGNGGTRRFAKNVPIGVTDVDGLLRFVEANGVDFTVVGPEACIATDIATKFRERGHRIFAPTRVAAMIELSKADAKVMMSRAGVPTAKFQIFDKPQEALAYVRGRTAPMVVKASGPAEGKGAYVCKTTAEAEAAVRKIMIDRAHGSAGDTVVIEDFLEGPEVSIHAFCDGKDFVLFPASRDHKRALDNDEGEENTGGMGAITPVPGFSKAMIDEVVTIIVSPILRELSRRGTPFVGCLYPGLKITSEGPKVLEFNARFGAPETEVYTRLLNSDLLPMLEACVDGTLAKCQVEWRHNCHAACVVLVSGGYPGSYEKGFPITGIEEAEKIPGVVVFRAGTFMGEDGILRTSGGRVLSVTATSNTLRDAIDTAYCAVSFIKFEGMNYRRDIGAKSLATA